MMTCVECGSIDKVLDRKYIPTADGGHVTLTKRTPLCLKCAELISKEVKDIYDKARRGQPNG